ncbi:MAG: dTDP-4-dehydrorhamnose 3,5-epimerase [Ignavibacteria bacterium]|nr:dTDP-4-dehydrorhamnose 3,5-epimerase [Ignavibacteria bacterium]
MKIIKTDIDGVLIIEPDVFNDARGFFFESYNDKKYGEAGLDFNFVQDNISKSAYGTIRGLHYQVGEYAQGKLCQVIKGKVLDVAVDIRFGSPAFGKYVDVELTEENHRQIWIPPGFAHGFSVLSEDAIFMYKCTAVYSKKDERSILFSDTDLNIKWRIDKPIVSEKDLYSKKFKDIEKDFIYKQ